MARLNTLLFLLVVAMAVLVWGILEKQWFIEEIGALFLAMGLLMGVVAGQKSNAIERDRVNHAYLFVGSRGTGKTSMAKILAR